MRLSNDFAFVLGILLLTISFASFKSIFKFEMCSLGKLHQPDEVMFTAFAIVVVVVVFAIVIAFDFRCFHFAAVIKKL